jgi:OTU domain-containing protein 6
LQSFEPFQQSKATKEKELQEDLEKLRHSGPTTQQLELETILAQLAVLDLKVRDIIPDGHCLYRAVADQLQINGEGSYDVQQLRKLTSKFVSEHANDFLPFMDIGDGVNPTGSIDHECMNDDEKYRDQILQTDFFFCLIMVLVFFALDFLILLAKMGLVLEIILSYDLCFV